MIVGVLVYIAIALFTPASFAASSLANTDDLVTAAGKGRTALVKQILDTKQISLAEKNSALFAAVEKGSSRTVRVLLDAGADKNYREKEGAFTVLMRASRDGRVPIVKMLLAAGAEINSATADKETALLQAVLKDRTKVVKLLLAAQANIQARRADGMNALMVAAQAGHLQVIKLLLKAGADVNATLDNGATPLMLAAQHGHQWAIYALIAAGAEVNAKASNGATALFLANKYKHREAIKLLRESGAN